MDTRLTPDALALHEALLQDLLTKIQGGTATAAELNVARQFLKDNGVDYLMVKNELPETPVLKGLPFTAPGSPAAASGQ